jgi:hypothetical protein
MIGRALHKASAATQAMTDAGWIERQPYVFLSNDDDHYWQGFETREELEAFIAQLREAGNKAFGPSDHIRMLQATLDPTRIRVADDGSITVAPFADDKGAA